MTDDQALRERLLALAQAGVIKDVSPAEIVERARAFLVFVGEAGRAEPDATFEGHIKDDVLTATEIKGTIWPGSRIVADPREGHGEERWETVITALVKASPDVSIYTVEYRNYPWSPWHRFRAFRPAGAGS